MTTSTLYLHSYLELTYNIKRNVELQELAESRPIFIQTRITITIFRNYNNYTYYTYLQIFISELPN